MKIVVFFISASILLSFPIGLPFNDPGLIANPDWLNQIKFTEAYQWYTSHGVGQASNIMVADAWVDCTVPDLQNRCVKVPGAPLDSTDATQYIDVPDFTHGTDVSGVAGGEVNNGISAGGTGISSAVGIIPNKVFKASKGGDGNTVVQTDFAWIKKAWRSALDLPNITVINNSAEVFIGDSETEQILDLLKDHGVTVVIGAGARVNQGVNLDLNSILVAYKKRHPNLIIVGMSDGDQIATGSNYGMTVDIFAPSNWPIPNVLGNRQGYSYANGYSISTALVSGALALIRSYQSDATKARASLLLGAAKNQRQPLLGKVAYGVLDLYDSLQMLDQPTGLTLLTPDGGDGTRAAAVSSVTQLAEPFSLRSPVNFGDDGITRLVFLAINWPTTGAPTTAQARDSQGTIHALTVEDVRSVPNFPWLTQITVKLDSTIPVPGDVSITISANGTLSNSLKVALKR